MYYENQYVFSGRMFKDAGARFTHFSTFIPTRSKLAFLTQDLETKRLESAPLYIPNSQQG